MRWWAHVGAAMLFAVGCSFDASGVGEVTTLAADDSGGSSSTATSSASQAATGSTGLTSATLSDSTSDSSGALDTTAGDGADATSSTGQPVLCTQLLWVTGNPDIASTKDASFYSAVLAEGYDVEIVASVMSAPEMAEDKCAVLLSAIGNSAEISTKFRDVAVPVVTWDHSLFDDMAMVPEGAQGTFGTDSIDIVDVAHPLAAGLQGTVVILSAIDAIAWGVPTSGVVATTSGMPAFAAVFFYESGQLMPGLPAAPERRVALPFASEAVAPPNANAIALFVAAVNWATL